MVIRYLFLWFALVLIGIGNGVLRESTYGNRVPELAAHQISTFIGMLLIGLFVWFVHRRWPIAGVLHAWFIGLCWLVFTIAFEFGFGRFVIGHSWERLLADYDIFSGRLWAVFLLWILVLPVLVHHRGRRG